MPLHKRVDDPMSMFPYSMMKPGPSQIQQVYLAFLSLMYTYLEYQLAYSTLHKNSPFDTKIAFPLCTLLQTLELSVHKHGTKRHLSKPKCSIKLSL